MTQRYPVPVKGNTLIEAGMFLFQERATGLAVPFAPATAGLSFLGIANRAADLMNLPDGSFKSGVGLVHYENGLHEVNIINGYVPKVGDEVFASDPWTVTNVDTTGTFVGRIVQPHKGGRWTINTEPAYFHRLAVTV